MFQQFDEIERVRRRRVVVEHFPLLSVLHQISPGGRAGLQGCHVADHHQARHRPGQGYVQSLDVCEEADPPTASPDTGHEDDVPLTALEDKQVWTFTA